MARRRKTQAEKRQEWEDKQDQWWESFEPKLAAVNSLSDAIALHKQAPGVNSPGRKFYSNLGFFLMNLSPPHGANRTELRHYLRIVRLFEKPSPEIEAKLLRAIESVDSWDMP
jgi:hypothetical protein